MTTISTDEVTVTDIQVRLKYSQSEKDDWTKVEEKALRKKIQNRLAKRKSRLKGPVDKTKKKHDPHEHPRETSDIAETSKEVATTKTCQHPQIEFSNGLSGEPLTASSSNSAPLHDNVNDEIQFFLTYPGLSEHRYISLMEYSVLRAFVQNAGLLALDPYLIVDDDALSPWTTSNPYPALMPHDLNPTPLQLSTPHHPYLDMIAPPSLRDNVLLSALTDEQENQLCFDMHSGSFTIWGSQPWSALGM